MTVRSEKLFDEHNKVGAYIIDSAGDRYRITGQRKVGHAGIIPWWLRRYSGRWVEVDFDLEYVDTLDVEAVRELVLPAARKRPEGRAVYDKYGLKAMREAETLEELIQSVGITE